MATSTLRDVNAARFAVFAGVIVALISQIVLTLLFTGIVGLILPPSAAAATTFNWTLFGTWALAGIIGAGFGGFMVGWSLDNATDWDVGILAFISWAIAILLVTFFSAIAAEGASGLLRTFTSPAYAYLASGETTAAARRAAAVASLASVIALLLGAAASIVGSQIATSQTAPASRRARS